MAPAAARLPRQIADRQIADGDIEHVVFTLDEEVMVIGDVGVEIGLGAFHGENADHPGLGELVQRVVDCRQRHRHAGGDGFLVQFLDRQVPVALGKQEIPEGNALAGRTKAGTAQSCFNANRGFWRHQGGTPVNSSVK